MSRRCALVLLLLCGLLLASGEHLSRRLLDDLGRKEPEVSQDT
jgi:hypothetical protein